MQASLIIYISCRLNVRLKFLTDGTKAGFAGSSNQQTSAPPMPSTKPSIFLQQHFIILIHAFL